MSFLLPPVLWDGAGSGAVGSNVVRERERNRGQANLIECWMMAVVSLSQ
jgi:hypothetical protein